MRSNLKSALLLGAAVALGTAACTRPAENAPKPGSTAALAVPSKPVATVNGKQISSKVFDVFLQAVTSKPAAEATPEQRQQLLDQLINMTLAAQQAEKDGLTKDADVQARLDLLHSQILAEAASEKYIKAHPVSEAEAKAEYDARVAQMPKEFKARHILVEKKETAESLIRELQAGGDFAKLAKAESKDQGTADKGGDLDWFSADSMVKPFSDAVAQLEKGAITTTPVHTQYGWHVIKLEDVRTPTPPAFEDVKQQVEAFTQRKKLQAYLDELRKQAKVEKTG